MKQNIYSSQAATSEAQKILCFHLKKYIRLRDKFTNTNQGLRTSPQHFLADYLTLLVGR